MNDFQRRRDLSVHINDLLVYIESYASTGFPVEDQTTVEQQMERLLALFRELEDRTKGPEQRQRLVLPREEVLQAWQAFRAGESEKGERLLRDASWHFKDALTKPKEKRVFIAGPDGVSTDEKK